MSVHLLRNANLDASSAIPPSRTGTVRKGAALRLVSTKDMDRDDWLEVRRTGIGSSDAATAVGLNPYQSQLELWMQKTGKADLLPAIDPNDDTSPMFWGTLLEPIVAAHYTKRTGNKVRRVNAVLQHPTHPWMLANVDREVMGSSDVQILECKTAGIHGARLWKDGVPEYVQLQVMHQLAVTGKQAADVAVLLGGQHLEIHRITRDEAMIRNLIQLERDFWQFVETDTPPPADGSASADLALRCLYPQDTGSTVDFSEDTALSAAFADLVSLRGRMAEDERRETQLKQFLQQTMGEASRARFETGEVSWKRAKDSVVLDVVTLLKEQPDLVQRYPLNKRGSRRFLIA